MKSLSEKYRELTQRLREKMVANPDTGLLDPQEAMKGINEIIQERQAAIGEEFKRRWEVAKGGPNPEPDSEPDGDGTAS